jgi:flagellin
MSLIINTNIYSLITQRSLATTNAQLAQAAQRLATGLRVNSARDDASGLAIATRLTTQIRGLNQGIRGLSDGISLAQTAEGGIDSISNNLQRLRELALQASSLLLSDSDRAALQLEAQQVRSEIGRVASQTTFNGRPLLNGQLVAGQFQAGPNLTDVLPFAGIGDLSAEALGFNVSLGEPQWLGEGPGNTPGFTATNLNILTTGTPVAQSLTLLGDVYQLGTFAPGAQNLAQAINALNVPGLAASTGANVLQGTVSSSYSNYFDPEGVLTLNGIDISLAGLSNNSLSQNIDLAVAAINAVSNETGVIASNGVAQGQGLVLTANDGRNITALFEATDINVTPTSSGSGPGNVPGFTENNITVTPGIATANYNITVLGDTYSLGELALDAGTLTQAISALGIEGLEVTANATVLNGNTNSDYQDFFDPEGVLTLNGVAITLTGSSSNTLDQNVDLAVAAINAVTAQTGVVASNGVAQNQGLILTSPSGGNIQAEFTPTDINVNLVSSGDGPGNVPGFTATDIAVPTQASVSNKSITVLGQTYQLGSFSAAADTLVTAVNSLGIEGLTASANENVVVGATDASYQNYFDPEGLLTLNGVEITLSGSRNNSLDQNVDLAVAAINAFSAQTGVVASNGVGAGQGLVLTAADGGNINAQFTATDINEDLAISGEGPGDVPGFIGESSVSPGSAPTAQSVTVLGTTYNLGTFVAGGQNLANAVNAASIPGLQAFASATTVEGTQDSGYYQYFDPQGILTINGVDITLQGNKNNSMSANVANAINSINAVSDQTGVTAQNGLGQGKGVILTAADGRNIVVDFTATDLNDDPIEDFLTTAANFGVSLTGPNGATSDVTFEFTAPEGVTSGQVVFSGSTNLGTLAFDVVGSIVDNDPAPNLASTAGNFGLTTTAPNGQNSSYNLSFVAPTGVTTGSVVVNYGGGLGSSTFNVSGSIEDADPAPDLATTAGNFGLSTTTGGGTGSSFNISFVAPTGVTEGTVQLSPGTRLSNSIFDIEGSFNPDADPAPDFSTVAANFGITTTGANGVSAPLNVSFVAPEGVYQGSLEFGVTSNVESPALNIVAEFAEPTEFLSVSDIDISTLEGANQAIQIVDGALQTVTTERAGLGAFLNRLDSAIANLRVSAENQTIARSRIMDADLAAESAAYAAALVLQESGIALLSQANALPFNVLRLLELR